MVRKVNMGYCNGGENLLLNLKKIPNVCADDKKTYLHCELLRKGCNEKNPPKLVHYGECGKCAQGNVCQWMKEKLNRNIWSKKPWVHTVMVLLRKKIWAMRKTVASDGRSYNKCEFQVAKCKRFQSDGSILKRVRSVTRKGKSSFHFFES